MSSSSSPSSSSSSLPTTTLSDEPVAVAPPPTVASVLGIPWWYYEDWPTLGQRDRELLARKRKRWNSRHPTTARLFQQHVSDVLADDDHDIATVEKKSRFTVETLYCIAAKRPASSLRQRPPPPPVVAKVK